MMEKKVSHQGANSIFINRKGNEGCYLREK